MAPFRALFDDDYLAAGCRGAPPHGTTTDNSIGTYVTNYVILGIGVLACVGALLSRARGSCKLLSVCFFGLTGLGYGVAGLMHQFFYEDESIIGRISYAIVLLGNAALHLLCTDLACQLFSAMSERTAVLANAMVLLFSVLCVLVVVVTKNVLVLVAATLLVPLMATIVWLVRAVRQVDNYAWAKAGAASLMFMGIVVQLVLRPYCGNPGYPHCFESCPLPAPDFNHNALFHVIFAIGLGIMGIAAWKAPEGQPAVPAAEAKAPASSTLGKETIGGDPVPVSVDAP